MKTSQSYGRSPEGGPIRVRRPSAPDLSVVEKGSGISTCPSPAWGLPGALVARLLDPWPMTVRRAGEARRGSLPLPMGRRSPPRSTVIGQGQRPLATPANRNSNRSVCNTERVSEMVAERFALALGASQAGPLPIWKFLRIDSELDSNLNAFGWISNRFPFGRFIGYCGFGTAQCLDVRYVVDSDGVLYLFSFSFYVDIELGLKPFRGKGQSLDGLTPWDTRGSHLRPWRFPRQSLSRAIPVSCETGYGHRRSAARFRSMDADRRVRPGRFAAGSDASASRGGLVSRDKRIVVLENAPHVVPTTGGPGPMMDRFFSFVHCPDFRRVHFLQFQATTCRRVRALCRVDFAALAALFNPHFYGQYSTERNGNSTGREAGQNDPRRGLLGLDLAPHRDRKRRIAHVLFGHVRTELQGQGWKVPVHAELRSGIASASCRFDRQDGHGTH